MRRFLRLLTLCLLALALPVQGALAAVAMAAPQGMDGWSPPAAAATMAPAQASAVVAMDRAQAGAPADAPSARRVAGADSPCPHALAAQARPSHAAGSPCPHHAVAKAGCGACCGPVAAQPGTLAVAPVAMRSARAAPACAAQPVPQFLTGGPDRPPRDLRA